MSSHYHVVLHVDEQQNESLSPEEVCERWYHFYSKPVLVERWQNKLTTSKYTSAYARIHSVAQAKEHPLISRFNKKPLFGLVGDEHEQNR